MNEIQAQSCGFLLELSPDWLILRASQNVRPFLGEYHQTLIGEPLADFTLAQPLHDLRNTLSRQRSAIGIARAYRVRLIDEPRHFDIAFQQVEDRILIEGIPSPTEGFGAALGSVSRLVDGIGDARSAGFLDNAARRMRALTGCDHVILRLDSGEQVESSRGAMTGLTTADLAELPAIVADTNVAPTAMFPQQAHGAAGHALLRAPSPDLLKRLGEAGFRSALCVPILRDGTKIGSFGCANRAPLEPSFELHAAAELFSQVVALQLTRA